MRIEHSRQVVPLRCRPPRVPSTVVYAPRNLLQAWTRVQSTPQPCMPAFALTKVFKLPAGAPRHTLHRWPSRAFKQCFEHSRQVVPLQRRPPRVPYAVVYTPRNLLQAWTRVQSTPPPGISVFTLVTCSPPSKALSSARPTVQHACNRKIARRTL